MAKYKFSRDDCQRGGKTRAAQAARWRIKNPTAAEAQVREAMLTLTQDCRYEFPISTAPGVEQYLDIFLPNYRLAIEVDGSNGQHDTMKMAWYDEQKARYCADHQIDLVTVNARELERYKDAPRDLMKYLIEKAASLHQEVL